ncbi:hypothetical protein ACQPZJ_16825 [Actinoplanes sp. CA-054009]
MVDFVHPASLLPGLPELTAVRKVWFSDWYDGPLTGMALHEGREYWFVMVTNDGGEHWDFQPRVYVLHRLTDEQLAQAWEMHRDFAQAGFPGCMHSPPCPVVGAAGRETSKALHDRWPPEHEDGYMNKPAVGWFRDA